MFNVEEELKKLPRKPGVYIMRDDKDVILYVGKAINLHNRVRSYFRENIGRGLAIDQMVSLIARFEYIVTDSELEALVLENNLIKENSPKYNTLLKDDKTYPYIKVTVGEDYPRILFSRTMKKDKSRYFGPYTSAAAVKDTIELLNKLYQLRTCNRVLPRDIGIERPCLNYHIKQCLAPCQGYVSKEEYRQQVAGALEFLNGNYSPILKDLEEKMKKAAEAMEFEDAARYRDLLSSVRQVSQKQKITEGVGEDKDILALYQDETEAVVQVFFVRDGKLIGREHYYMTHVPENNKPAILQDFVKQFYAGTPFIPRELMLQYEIEDAELIEKWLSERKGSRVYLKVPKIGSKEKLVELAAQNAKLVLSQDREKLKREEGRTIGAVKEISDLLQLPLTGTARMEAYDISNINGFENVGSMVVYEKGKPKRSDYRKFKIKSVSGPDDYACMREVLTRRFRHGMEESKELEEQEMDQEYGSFTKFPDLILMDTQLSDMDGIGLIQWFREWTDCPILVVSGQTGYMDKVNALYAGADDYIVKPFHEQELAARIYTALRRRIPGGQGSFYQAGDLKIDFSRRQVSLAGEEIHFSPVEYRILECLALNSGTVVTYQMLLEKIWGPYASSGSRILRVNMTNIRKKIEKIPMDPTYITTIPRVGYRMLESQTASVV